MNVEKMKMHLKEGTMTISERRRIMIKVASMYYLEGMTQSQIAKKLGINRSTISRMLKEAREMGIVRIEIEDNFKNESIELERALEKRLGLKEVVLVQNKSENMAVNAKQKLAKAAIEYFKRIVKDGDVIGFSWGSTIGGISNYLTSDKEVAANIVPLVGGPVNIKNDYHVNQIVHKVAHAFKAKSHFIYAPAITGKKETRDAIVNDENFKTINELWGKVNKAFVGIGTLNNALDATWAELLNENDKNFLQEAKAVGDICTRFYDIDGQVIESNINDRTISIDINQFRNMEYVVGIAVSTEKVEAIYGATKGKLINVLITDESTGRQLLHFKKE